ncbi:MAG: Gfo/Idh/MocA family oxidoreductase [Alistipes sp.]|nr:Gfo/Idh/MocA family oxidoreductase [Alistipes sp.]
MDRRDFLKMCAASAAFSMLRPFGAMANEKINRPVRIGFIGTGNRGTYGVITAMSHNNNIEIYALADLFRDRIDSVLPHLNSLNAAKGLTAISEERIFVGNKAYKQLLKLKEVDAVVIATPAYAHPMIFEAAVKAHKHVYCEKPAAPDVYGTLQMMKAAKGVKDLSLVMGFQVRYSSAYAEMIRRIHNGDIGEVLTAQLYYNGNGGAVQKPKKEDDEFRIRHHFQYLALSGGILNDQGIHIIDICNEVLKAHPEYAFGIGNDKGKRHEIGDTLSNYHILYGYPNGVNVSCQSLQAGNIFGDVCARFIGSKGFAEAHYSGGVFIKGENEWNSGIQNALGDADALKGKSFIDSITSGNYINQIESACNSTLAAMLGREAVMKGERLTWEEMIREKQRYGDQPNLSKF